jgi:hypothetical protein
MREAFYKSDESGWAFEVVKEDLDGDSGADEDGGAAYDVGGGVDDVLSIESGCSWWGS